MKIKYNKGFVVIGEKPEIDTLKNFVNAAKDLRTIVFETKLTNPFYKASLSQFALDDLVSEIFRRRENFFEFPSFKSPEDEIKHYKKNPRINFDYSKIREPWKESLAELVSFLWKRFNLPISKVVELGAGPTGYFYENLIPAKVTTKNWVQYDPLPRAVEQNKRKHPKAKIEDGSYYRINIAKIPLIVGLSSLDTSQFIQLSIQNVSKALKSGGYFLHTQDISPGTLGVTEYLRSVGSYPKTVYGIIDPKIGQPIPLVYHYNGKKVRAIGLFREAVEFAIKSTPKLRLVENRYYSYIYPISFWELQSACFVHSRYPIKTKQGIKLTAILVTLARKI